MMSSFYKREQDLMMDLIENKNSDKYITISDLMKHLEAHVKNGTTAKCALLTDENLGVTYLYTIGVDETECEITPIYKNKDEVCINQIFHIRVLADQVTIHDIHKVQIYEHCNSLPFRDKDKTSAICISSNGRKCSLVSETPSNHYIRIEGEEKVTTDFNVKIIYSTVKSRKDYFSETRG